MWSFVFCLDSPSLGAIPLLSSLECTCRNNSSCVGFGPAAQEETVQNCSTPIQACVLSRKCDQWGCTCARPMHPVTCSGHFRYPREHSDERQHSLHRSRRGEFREIHDNLPCTRVPGRPNIVGPRVHNMPILDRGRASSFVGCGASIPNTSFGCLSVFGAGGEVKTACIAPHHVYGR